MVTHTAENPPDRTDTSYCFTENGTRVQSYSPGVYQRKPCSAWAVTVKPSYDMSDTRLQKDHWLLRGDFKRWKNHATKSRRLQLESPLLLPSLRTRGVLFNFSKLLLHVQSGRKNDPKRAEATIKQKGGSRALAHRLVCAIEAHDWRPAFLLLPHSLGLVDTNRK